jgi:hypothetical protein
LPGDRLDYGVGLRGIDRTVEDDPPANTLAGVRHVGLFDADPVVAPPRDHHRVQPLGLKEASQLAVARSDPVGSVCGRIRYSLAPASSHT